MFENTHAPVWHRSLRVVVRSARVLALPVALAGSLWRAGSVRSDNSQQAESASDVVASYNGGQITRAEMEAVIAKKLPEERAKLAKSGGREALLESIVRYDLLVLEARKR